MVLAGDAAANEVAIASIESENRPTIAGENAERTGYLLI